MAGNSRLFEVLLLALVVACGAQRNVINISLCDPVKESVSLFSSDVFAVSSDASKCGNQTSGLVVSLVYLKVFAHSKTAHVLL